MKELNFSGIPTDVLKGAVKGQEEGLTCEFIDGQFYYNDDVVEFLK